MRSDRLLGCLLLLQAQPRQTAARLAASLEVSVRTVYRDIDALCSAGVPLRTQRGAGGGIALEAGYHRALLGFSPDELRAIFAADASPLRDLGIVVHDGALRKLAGALPAPQRGAAVRARDELLLDHNRWYRADPPRAELAFLRDAVAGTRRVMLRYRDRRGEATARLVDPLGLVAKAGVWYLVARNDGGELRSFRVDRIAAFGDGGATFARPADFDLDSYWRGSVAALEARARESYETLLEVDAEHADRVRGMWDSEVVAERADALLLRVRFPGPETAAASAIVWCAFARIVEPDELRAAVATAARAALACYGATGSATPR